MDGNSIKINNLNENNTDNPLTDLILDDNSTDSSKNNSKDSELEEKGDITSNPDEQGEEYDFLNKDKKSLNDADIVTTQFDSAFKKSSPVIQNYILNDKFEENIKLICKIEKLDEDKAKIIIENITVSILVGLLPISVAKDTMIESFRSSGILLESFTAGMIMKSIDTYILSDIRKKILESKVDSNREIRHLTLKEKRDETAKEDLRKILLEKTGNISGAGQPLIQYQHRDLSQEKKVAQVKLEKESKPELNRETLLSKLGLVDITDTQKALDRMREIKKAEENRIENIKNPSNSNQASDLDETIDAKEKLGNNNETSNNLASILQNKLNRKEDENTNLDNLREQRGIKEAEIEKNKNTFNFNTTENNYTESTDPYRETIT